MPTGEKFAVSILRETAERLLKVSDKNRITKEELLAEIAQAGKSLSNAKQLLH